MLIWTAGESHDVEITYDVISSCYAYLLMVGSMYEGSQGHTQYSHKANRLSTICSSIPEEFLPPVYPISRNLLLLYMGNLKSAEKINSAANRQLLFFQRCVTYLGHLILQTWPQQRLCYLICSSSTASKTNSIINRLINWSTVSWYTEGWLFCFFVLGREHRL